VELIGYSCCGNGEVSRIPWLKEIIIFVILSRVNCVGLYTNKEVLYTEKPCGRIDAPSIEGNGGRLTKIMFLFIKNLLRPDSRSLLWFLPYVQYVKTSSLLPKRLLLDTGIGVVCTEVNIGL